MRLRLALAAIFSMLLMSLSLSTASAATTVDPSAAPRGTHVQTGTPSCAANEAGDVTCTDFELAGVGNTDATATLVASYSATVQCRNHGGKIVEVHSQTTTSTSRTGELSPKNGRLYVPELSSSAPTETAFEGLATCPNRNWTPELLEGSITLDSFVYTLTFDGYSGAYITITG